MTKSLEEIAIETLEAIGASVNSKNMSLVGSILHQMEKEIEQREARENPILLRQYDELQRFAFSVVNECPKSSRITFIEMLDRHIQERKYFSREDFG